MTSEMLGQIIVVLLAVGGAVSGMVKWVQGRFDMVYTRLEECGDERLVMTGEIGTLREQVKDCVEDRIDLRKNMDEMKLKMRQVDKHIQHTDSKIEEIEKNSEGNT